MPPGGNSNWRGPLWFPTTFLLIESLQAFDHYHGDALKVDMPTRSGNKCTLWECARELSVRMIRLFQRNPDTGRRAVFGGGAAGDLYNTHPRLKDRVLFYEYFHGEDGAGLGASHQTGWTALVAKLIMQSGPFADSCAWVV